ncbi:hypothetical protein PoB_003318700 [Plakobranchus ocellatus]|uniref:Secreted protein n=1 Tax=Plakobranchus ocellatus TaxID=259542 RepID=A0AAV4AHE1_9GAST|nr:hypothetical protein PoB_003318700 [Plakobranchus ocellatus]
MHSTMSRQRKVARGLPAGLLKVACPLLHEQALTSDRTNPVQMVAETSHYRPCTLIVADQATSQGGAHNEVSSICKKMHKVRHHPPFSKHLQVDITT